MDVLDGRPGRLYEFIAERGIDVDRVYTGRWSRDQAAEAYRLFDQGICGKGVFLM